MLFTRTLPDELVASVEAYIALPQNQIWAYDAIAQMNTSTPRWATVADYLAWSFDQALMAPLTTCPPQAYLDEVAVLDEMKQQALKAYLPSAE